MHSLSPSVGTPRALVSAGALLLSACALAPERPERRLAIELPPPQEAPFTGTPRYQDSSLAGEPERRSSRGDWKVGQQMVQGFLGVTQYSDVEVEGAGSGSTSSDDGEADEMPLIGGGAMWKLAGERVDLGLEALISFSGRADAEAFAIGGMGAVVAVDVDLLVFELFGGPFASVTLGERVRLYGGAGPIGQWADWDQSGSGLDDSGSGFGYGYYVRTGVELVLSKTSLFGLGARWSDTSADLGGSLGDLEIDGLQLVLTVSGFL